MSQEVREPAFRAFTVIKREGHDDFWQPIGAAFETKGGGLNLILQALPFPGMDGVCKIVLRPPKDDDDKTRQAVREANDRRRGR